MRGGFPENLTNVPQKIAVLRRDDSSNLAFHRQKSKFTKKGLARALALPEMPRHMHFQLSPVQYPQLASIELN
jgi:hypothetical protein